MAKPKSKAREIVEDVCRAFPETPDKTIARKLMKDYSIYFTDLENARLMVRNVRGHQGEKKRKEISDKSLFKPVIKNTTFICPDPEPESWKPFKLPKVNNNILHLQDIHCPYHSKASLELAVEYAKNKGVNTVLLGYDFMDYHPLSRFEKDPAKRDVQYEVDTANAILDWLQQELPTAKFFWRNGNHDVRMIRYLRVKAPELLNMRVLQISELLRFGERGITWIPDKQIVYAGNLAIIHGDEFNGGTGGVNPARGLYLKASGSALCGHSHRTSEHSEPNINGDVSTTYSVGCNCGLHPEYAVLNKWNLGWAHILVYPDGHFHVNNMKIINGKIV